MANPLAQWIGRFGFRTDQGRIDAKTWWQGTLFLSGLLVLLTLIWIVLAPYTRHDLATTPFLALATVAAFAYLIFYAFAVLLIAICHYNLSTKRWRDRGWMYPGALAGLLPLAALSSGALHWLQPRVPDTLSYGYVLILDAALAAIALWNLLELGFRKALKP